jgi:Ca-activated chloride channel homolog
MSFAEPLVLLGLLGIPLLVWWYASQQHRRARAAAAFVAPKLSGSVVARRPGWRRHAPMLAFALALIVLVGAVARPQRSVAKPVTDGVVMLADDTSGSMQATDVAPSRLRAALRAARRFVNDVPSTVQVGLLEFARRTTTVQSPTTDHALAIRALSTVPSTSGGTAVGVALTTATNEIRSVPRVGGKRPPGAIVLISDGASNVGISPLQVARQDRAEHIPVYTISVGTPNGTITIRQGGKTTTAPVPVSREQLGEIASLSGGKTFTASDTAGLSAAYAHLAARLGKKHINEDITTSFAGLGLALLVLGSVMALRWFGRLI